MLATSDDADGLPGHVSGFAQFTIFIFMFGVQVAVTVQEAIFHGISGYSETVHVERYLVKECMRHSASNDQYPVIQINLPPIIIPTKRIADSHPFLAGVNSRSHSEKESNKNGKLFRE